MILATRGQPVDRPPRAILSDLAHADGSRPVEMRVSLPLPYAPFRMTTTKKWKTSVDSRLLSEVWRVALPGEPGLTNLFLGEWDRAVEILQRVEAPRSSVDLAAAYYMRGLATDSLLDFCRALDALADASDDAEVLFNRALILEQLFDFEAAAAMWQQYLMKDEGSAWATEARRHLQQNLEPSVAATWLRDKPRLLEAARTGNTERTRELAARYPLATRQLVELELLPSWGESILRGDPPAAESTLNTARLIVTERLVRDERLLEDAIREIDDAAAPARLTKAYASYGAGMKALDVSKHADALDLFADALKAAGADASAFNALVVPNVVVAHYRRYEYQEAEALIETTRARYADRSGQYLTLFARLDWLAGLRHIARPDATLALRSYARALVGYERLREAEYRAALHITHADSYIYLGDAERAAVHLRKALRLVSMAEDPRRLQGTLKTAARLSQEWAGAAAALAFQDRLVRVAREASDPMRLPDALVARSAVLSRAGRRDDALRDLADVWRLAPRIADLPTRRRMEADAGTAEAFAYRDLDDRRVLESLSRALDRYRSLDMQAFLAQLLLERGRTHLRLGDAAAAERDFRGGVDVLESQRDLVGEASLRISYLDRADRIFEDLAALLLRRGHVEDAFELLERFRSRELLDQTSGKSTRPLGIAEIRSRLPENTILVTHNAHAQGLMTFVATRDSLRAFEVGIDRAVLGFLVDRVSASFESRSLPADVLRRLGEILFDGVDAPAGSRIIFVPDEVVSPVPFAALRMANGSYLVESHASSVSPSATLLAWNLRREGGGPGGRPRSMLIVASPEQPLGYDDLPPLTRTVAEARHVAESYASSRLLSASDADAGAILSAATGYDILHFAGHSVVNRRRPAQSALLIGATGRITAAQIEAANLSHLELVVLGGCNTGVGKSHRSEGSMSLARAFLAAGVPAVLSTISRVEDGTAERVLTRFHRAYARGLDAPAALREAQLQMLRSGGVRTADPASWSSFRIIGNGIERR